MICYKIFNKKKENAFFKKKKKIIYHQYIYIYNSNCFHMHEELKSEILEYNHCIGSDILPIS